MIGFLHIGWGVGGRGRDRRLEMIRETEAFLNWALSQDCRLPRIPTAPLNADGGGGFSRMLAQPGVRQFCWHWWQRALDAAWPDRF